MPSRFNQVGMVIDPYLLDNITRDIQEGYNGARGFRVQHAFIVTWERMAFGGAAKAVDVSQFNEVKQWVLALRALKPLHKLSLVAKHLSTGDSVGRNPHMDNLQLRTPQLDHFNGSGWFERFRWQTGARVYMLLCR